MSVLLWVRYSEAFPGWNASRGPGKHSIIHWNNVWTVYKHRYSYHTGKDTHRHTSKTPPGQTRFHRCHALSMSCACFQRSHLRYPLGHALVDMPMAKWVYGSHIRQPSWRVHVGTTTGTSTRIQDLPVCWLLIDGIFFDAEPKTAKPKGQQDAIQIVLHAS